MITKLECPDCHKVTCQSWVGTKEVSDAHTSTVATMQCTHCGKTYTIVVCEDRLEDYL
jgi:hypothetical protein